jgi:L-threonylcarbamoyladenylate synthase
VIEHSEAIKNGSIGVIPTDTLYAIVASALISEAVERVYALKHRDIGKPCIILIPALREVEEFGITLTNTVRDALEKVWPGPTTAILPCSNAQFEYLHRGTGTLAFRVPKHDELIALMREVGPLIAPSANPEGLLPARTIDEAKEYFGEDVQFYVDGGRLEGSPSTILKIHDDGTTEKVR